MSATQQQKVLAMFAALDADGLFYAFDALEFEYERVQAARRSVLRLMQGGLTTRIVADTKTNVGRNGGVQ